MNKPCTLQAQIDAEGYISLVNSDADLDLNLWQGFMYEWTPPHAEVEQIFDKVKLDSGNRFRVNWSGAFPTVADNCGETDSCVVHEDTCVCDTSTSTEAVFTNAKAPCPVRGNVSAM